MTEKRVDIPEGDLRINRWREEMDEWGATNILGRPVSMQTNEAMRAEGQRRLDLHGIAGRVVPELRYACPADATGLRGGWTEPFCEYSDNKPGTCPTHGFPLHGSTLNLVVNLLDLWKLDRVREWPFRPLLPMKRTRGEEDMEWGTFVEGQGPRVILRQVFEMGGYSMEQLEAMEPALQYESNVAMLSDGWLVD